MISVFPLAYFIIRTQYKIHITYKNVCQWTVYVIGEASGQQVLGFKSYTQIFYCMGVGTPNPRVI